MSRTDADRHPHIIWELTRACTLACMNCPIGAQRRRSVLELSTYEGYRTIDQIATMQPRTFVMTGGDPFERADTMQFIEYARRRGLDPILNISATPSLTADVLMLARRSGLTRVAIGIDSPHPERHDAVHGIIGSFGATLNAVRNARARGLIVEVNTLVSRQNTRDLPAMPELLNELDVSAWNLYFIVPAGPSKAIGMPTGEEIESVFDFVCESATRWGLRIRTIEAPQYRRYIAQKGVLALHGAPEERIFISHSGEVTPSEFLPLTAGNLLYQPLGIIYRSGDLFVALRDINNLKGKCGRCEYRDICGGSRARAFAMTGDAFGSDPLCAYQPGGFDVAAGMEMHDA
jgi:radical SAM protein with 4Fe4S-binding SPASM domain